MRKIHANTNTWANTICFWCIPGDSVIYEGTIVNETTNGVTLQSDSIPRVNSHLWVLSLPSELVADETLTSEKISLHPLACFGTVTREESINKVTIQFEEGDKERLRYRRIVRSEACIEIISNGQRCVINLSGKLNIEAATLVQRHIAKMRDTVQDFLITLHQLEGALSSAISILRTCITKFDLDGLAISVIINDPSSIPNLKKGFVLSNGYELDLNSAHDFITDPLPEESQQPPRQPQAPNQAHVVKETPLPAPPPVATQSSIPQPQPVAQKPTQPPSKETPGNIVLIISPSTAMFTIIARPFEQLGIPFIHASSYLDGIIKITSQKPCCLVVDFEIADSEEFIKLNHILEHDLSRLPDVVVIGPERLGPLVQAALKLPVLHYLNKPFTQRMFIPVLQSLLGMHPHLRKTTF